METALAGMGTELQYTPNHFATLLKSNNDLVIKAFSYRDSRFGCNNRLLKVGIRTGFDLVQVSMDRLLEQYSRESVRNTMLKHEEIFKQQVHELHRLYRVQKILTAEMRSKEVKLHSLTTATTPAALTDARTRFWGSTSTSETSHSSHIGNKDHSTWHLNSEHSSQLRYSKMEGLSSRELSTCSEDLRTQKGFNLELPAEEDTGTRAGGTTVLRKHLKEAMSMDGPDLWADGESDVELTLSIGRCSNLKKPKQGIDPRGIELGEECDEPSAGFERESLQRPRWLFQTLSLNRT